MSNQSKLWKGPKHWRMHYKVALTNIVILWRCSICDGILFSVEMKCSAAGEKDVAQCVLFW